MAFEFFKESGRGFRPRASIRKQGQIGLNHGAVRRFGLEKWGYVVLGYDRDSNRVALKLTNDEDAPGAQRLAIKDGSASISARAFLEYFDIPYRDETRQFDVVLDEGRDLVIVTLEECAKNGEREHGNLAREQN